MLATRQLLLRFQSHPSSRCCSWLSTTTAAASSSATAAAANNHHAAASNHHAATDAAVGRPRYIADNDQRSSTTTTAAAAATSNSAAAIRRDFVQYFVDRGHEHVKSSSLVPQNDPTLLFVNAGMVQFKDRFLHPRASSSGRLTSAVSVQKCMRAGGKHNDLTNVGYTPRHHTFFEMLGNFSFGGYFKETAIPLAWDYLTAHLQLPKDRLMITVYETDDESYAIWRDKIGVPESRIWRLGAADNYWSMGDGPGPCGPCTEIHFDLQNGLDARDPERYMEIWNVVFMQEQKVASSSGQLSLAPLETKCIDTGMGLERLARVLQGKASNFEIDSLASLTAATAAAASAASQASGQLATPPTAFLNIVADHVRAASFLIADGVIPSNLGRGYVLRRVIRRAAGVGLQMGLKKPFLADLVPVLLASTDPTFYPEIFARQTEICAILKQEEEVFSSALHSGVSMLNSEIDAAVQRKQAVLAPATVFRLHESHGFPIDLARIISTQRGVSFDEQAIEQMVVDNREMTRQRSRATGSAASLLTNANSKQETTQLKEAIVSWKAQGLRSLFVGYETAESPSSSLGVQSTILAMAEARDSKVKLAVVDQSPLYPEGGGQVGETGDVLSSDGSTLLGVVETTSKPAGDFITIRIRPADSDVDGTAFDSIAAGGKIQLRSHASLRHVISAHHTAVHMLNAALRKMFGTTVVQAGSLVTSQRLRFDFTHKAALSDAQVEQLEAAVNGIAQSRLPVQTEVLPLAEAQRRGAISMLNETYSENVRVVKIGDVSMELCGGTHASNSHSVFPFKIVAQSSVAAGTRRIEAVAGETAITWLAGQQQVLGRIARTLKVEPGPGVEDALNALVQRLKDQTKAIDAAMVKRASSPWNEAQELSGLLAVADTTAVSVSFRMVDSSEPSSFANVRAERLANALQPTVVHVVIGSDNSMAVAIPAAPQLQSSTPSAPSTTPLRASALWKSLASVLGGGKGGGSDNLATGRLSAQPTFDELKAKLSQHSQPWSGATSHQARWVIPSK